VRLKTSYTAREVAGLTGLTARQLQSWDASRVFLPAIAPRKTSAGGFTERRYTPVDVLELLALAELRNQGLSVGDLRRILETLRDRFHVRLFETIGPGGPLTLLTDGHDVYARTERGELFNLLRNPLQPLLMIGPDGEMREVSSRVSKRRKRAKRKV